MKANTVSSHGSPQDFICMFPVSVKYTLALGHVSSILGRTMLSVVGLQICFERDILDDDKAFGLIISVMSCSACHAEINVLKLRVYHNLFPNVDII